VIENVEWVSQSGNPVAYAPHLRKDPLPDVPAKSVLFQFAKGDQTMTNPTSTAILRAGGLEDLAGRTTFYLHDLALAENSALLVDPHSFLTASTVIALGAQRQIATFFASDGQVIDKLADITTVRDTPLAPKGTPLFEVPIKGPLPEGLNYPGSAPAAAPAQVSGSLASGRITTNAATLESPSAARTVTWAARAIQVPLAGPSARPPAPLIDLVLEALPLLGWPDPALDDPAGGLLRPARRRR
jgi:hypothetical protein